MCRVPQVLQLLRIRVIAIDHSETVCVGIPEAQNATPATEERLGDWTTGDPKRQRTELQSNLKHYKRERHAEGDQADTP